MGEDPKDFLPQGDRHDFFPGGDEADDVVGGVVVPLVGLLLHDVAFVPGKEDLPQLFLAFPLQDDLQARHVVDHQGPHARQGPPVPEIVEEPLFRPEKLGDHLLPGAHQVGAGHAQEARPLLRQRLGVFPDVHEYLVDDPPGRLFGQTPDALDPRRAETERALPRIPEIQGPVKGGLPVIPAGAAPVVPDELVHPGVPVRRVFDDGVFQLPLQGHRPALDARPVKGFEDPAAEDVEIPGNIDIVEMDESGHLVAVGGPQVPEHPAPDDVAKKGAVDVTADGDHRITDLSRGRRRPARREFRNAALSGSFPTGRPRFPR